MLSADVAAMTALVHPDMKINAPTNRILGRDQFLAMMASGAIAAEDFTRVP